MTGNESKVARSAVQPEKSPLDRGWFVYIVRCADATLYTGITNNLVRRVDQHNQGTASRYTRSRRPVMLTYQESLPSRSQALKREFAIKRLTRDAKESLISLRIP